MNPIVERRLRMKEARHSLSEEDWLTNCPLREYASSDFGKKVVKGPPKATDEYTTKQLIEKGMIGVYEL